MHFHFYPIWRLWLGSLSTSFSMDWAFLDYICCLCLCHWTLLLYVFFYRIIKGGWGSIWGSKGKAAISKFGIFGTMLFALSYHMFYYLIWFTGSGEVLSFADPIFNFSFLLYICFLVWSPSILFFLFWAEKGGERAKYVFEEILVVSGKPLGD